ncbi:VanW family protein [Corynebacterium casei]|uniref:VanW family protein n=1 Tax=Corynebacterium casei TaxID=160386 RepID=UPI0026480B5A|nr:VanW family protein [Corynebacterium casei]MDN5739868.1 VanW family protein [Corynebacterium casei]MDN5783364.1 VanW family protein [Corynebacterium casei]MDN5799366.1 VanW family protein [Corynebacterium casei]MDN5839916.1 VanW family protein [Corynebacterium casei]MDN5883292.1 VanW family protein [Corynebacterium casei]
MKKAGTGKKWAIIAGLLVGLLVILGVAYALDVVSGKGKLPRKTSVGGVDISRMEPAAAIDKLQSELGSATTEPVSVTAGERTAEFIPEQAGMSLDFETAVNSIPEASMNPFSRLAAFVGSPNEIDVDADVDAQALEPVINRLEGELSFDATDGQVAIEEGEVRTVDAVLGQGVDRAQLEENVTSNWLDPEGVEVEPIEVEPAITQDKVDEFADGPAKAALNGALELKGRSDVTATLDEEVISSFVAVERVEDNLELAINTEHAQELFDATLADTETEMQNAQISFASGSMQVTPHSDGEIIDWETTLDGFDKRVVGEEPREWEAAYEDEEATFTTEQAQNASFDQTVGEFTTSGYSAASGRNIELTAQMVNGAVVSPGDTFSLNGYTGPRGTAQGFVESGIIIDGHAGTAVGGGISQFATTLYNASYFGGMTDVAHTPHSYYISRYPAGREATVYEGAIDLQFKNDSDYPVQVVTSVGGGSVTVKLMGVKTVDVESVNNGRWAPTSPQRMELTGDDCSPSGGAPGFTTSDTRIIRDLNGNEMNRETTTTVYDPQPIVTCS